MKLMAWMLLLAALTHAQDKQDKPKLSWKDKKSFYTCEVWYMYRDDDGERVGEVTKCEDDGDYVSEVDHHVYGIFDNLPAAKKRCEEVYTRNGQGYPDHGEAKVVQVVDATNKRTAPTAPPDELSPIQRAMGMGYNCGQVNGAFQVLQQIRPLLASDLSKSELDRTVAGIRLEYFDRGCRRVEGEIRVDPTFQAGSRH